MAYASKSPEGSYKKRKKERQGRVGVEGYPFLQTTGNASKHAWNRQTDRQLLHARCSRDGSLSQIYRFKSKHERALAVDGLLRSKPSFTRGDPRSLIFKLSKQKRFS